MAEDTEEISLKCFIYKFMNKNDLKRIHLIRQSVTDKCLVVLHENQALEFIRLDRKYLENAEIIQNIKR